MKTDITEIYKNRLILLIIGLLASIVVFSQQAVIVVAQTPDSIEQQIQQCLQSGGQWDGSQGVCLQTNLKTDCKEQVLTRDNCKIIDYLVIGINFLSAVAGLAIVASLMFAGYQYMTARDNAGQIQQAKNRIVWTIISLVLFIFMYAILNFLVPGGVL